MDEIKPFVSNVTQPSEIFAGTGKKPIVVYTLEMRTAPMTMQSRYTQLNGAPPVSSRQQGFTFIEMVIVVVLLGLLAATAVPRLLNATDDAQRAALEGMAGGFTTAIAIAKSQWSVDGNNAGGPTTPADKVAVSLDGTLVYMNEFGWPANTNPNVDSGADNQTEVECQEVWDAVLQSSPPSTVQRNSRANARYFISVLSGAGGDNAGNNGDVCRYELITNGDSSTSSAYYFDYDLVTGQVRPVTPLN